MGLLGSALGVAGNLIATNINNKAQRDLYEQQYRDSLAFYNMQKDDNYQMWLENNAYNSPAAQAERMRQAGLNVDLQQVDAGNSSSPSSVPSANVPEQEYTPIMGIGDLFAALPSILDIVKQLREIDSEGLYYDEQIRNNIRERVMNYMSPEAAEAIETGKSFNILPYEFDLGLPRMSKRRTKKYFELAQEYYNSPELAAAFREVEKRNSAAQFENQKIKNNPLFGNSGGVLSAFMQMVVQNEELMMQANSAQNKYKSEYYDTLDGSVSAEAVNSENAYKKTSFDNKNIEEKVMSNFLKFYEDFVGTPASGQGDSLGSLLALLYLANLNEKMPDLSGLGSAVKLYKAFKNPSKAAKLLK